MDQRKLLIKSNNSIFFELSRLTDRLQIQERSFIMYQRQNKMKRVVQQVVNLYNKVSVGYF